MRMKQRHWLASRANAESVESQKYGHRGINCRQKDNNKENNSRSNNKNEKGKDSGESATSVVQEGIKRRNVGRNMGSLMMWPRL